MSAHTPGPWEYAEEGYEPCVMAGDYYVATAHAGMPGDDYGVGEAQANARLIAAAPDLLAVVRKTVRELEQLAPTRAPAHPLMADAERTQRAAAFAFLDQLIAEHHAAIAKAEGRS